MEGKPNPAQVQWERLATQRPTAPDAQGVGEPGTLGFDLYSINKEQIYTRKD
jgi:hypothetical protein